MIEWALLCALPILLGTLELAAHGQASAAAAGHPVSDHRLRSVRSVVLRALDKVAASAVMQQRRWVPLARQIAAARSSHSTPSAARPAGGASQATSDDGAVALGSPTKEGSVSGSASSPASTSPVESSGGAAHVAESPEAELDMPPLISPLISPLHLSRRGGGVALPAGTGSSWPAQALSAWLDDVGIAPRTRGLLVREREQLLLNLCAPPPSASVSSASPLVGRGRAGSERRAELCRRLVRLARAHTSAPEHASTCAGALSLLGKLLQADLPDIDPHVVGALRGSGAMALCVKLIACPTTSPAVVERCCSLACDLLALLSLPQSRPPSERAEDPSCDAHAEAWWSICSPGGDGRGFCEQCHVRLVEAADLLRAEAVDSHGVADSAPSAASLGASAIAPPPPPPHPSRLWAGSEAWSEEWMGDGRVGDGWVGDGWMGETLAESETLPAGIAAAGPAGVLRAAAATLKLLKALCAASDPLPTQDFMREQPGSPDPQNLVLDVAALLPALVPPALVAPARPSEPSGAAARGAADSSSRAALALLVMETLEAMVAGANEVNQRLLVHRQVPQACSAILTVADVPVPSQAAPPASALGGEATAADSRAAVSRAADSRALRRGALALLAALLEGHPDASLTVELAHAIDVRTLRSLVVAEYQRYMARRKLAADRLYGTVLEVLRRDAARAEAALRESSTASGAAGPPAAATAAPSVDLMSPRSEEARRATLVAQAEAHEAALQPAGAEDESMREAFRAYILLRLVSDAAPELMVAAKAEAHAHVAAELMAAAKAEAEGRQEDTGRWLTGGTGVAGRGGRLAADAEGRQGSIFTAAELEQMPWLRSLSGGSGGRASTTTAVPRADRDFDEAAAFYDRRIAWVDVRWGEGAATPVVFPMPAATEYLPATYAAELEREVAREAGSARLLDLTLRADEVSACMEHREWLSTTSLLGPLFAVVVPWLGPAVLANAALLNLLAATAMQVHTSNGRPRLAGASLLIPLLALAQLLATTLLLAAGVLEAAVPALERQWRCRRLAAALRSREQSANGGDAISGDAISGGGGGGGGGARGGSRLRGLLLDIWPVRALWQRLSSVQRVVGMIRDGRIRGSRGPRSSPTDGFPEHLLWARALRSLASVALVAVEPPLLHGLAVLACGVPAIFVAQTAPIFLAVQLVLLIAGRSEGARKAAATLAAPWLQLACAAIMGACLLYLHAVLAYYLFGETLAGVPCVPAAGRGGGPVDADEPLIEGGLAACVAASLVGNGLMPYAWSGATPSPSDADAHASPLARLALDVSCYLSVGVLTLGVALATMLDAFETARQDEIATSHALASQCAVCGLTRAHAEARGESFEAHSHAPFSYVLFLVHVRAKRRAAEPLTALEASVERRAAALDLSWFPRAEVEPRTGPHRSAAPMVKHAAPAGDQAPSNEVADALRRLLGMAPAGVSSRKPTA